MSFLVVRHIIGYRVCVIKCCKLKFHELSLLKRCLRDVHNIVTGAARGFFSVLQTQFSSLCKTIYEDKVLVQPSQGLLNLHFQYLDPAASQYGVKQ